MSYLPRHLRSSERCNPLQSRSERAALDLCRICRATLDHRRGLILSNLAQKGLRKTSIVFCRRQPGPRSFFRGELGRGGPNLGQIGWGGPYVYGPYPFMYCSGVSESV